MVYNVTRPPLLQHSLLSGDAAKLRDWVNSLKTPSPRSTVFNFTASHEGIGVRPVEGILAPEEIQALVDHTLRRGGRVSYKRNADGSDSAYELNISYVDAVTVPQAAESVQVQQFLLSQAIELALAGVPAIYIHSLLGSHNDLEAVATTGHNRAINRQKLDYEALDQALNDPTSFRSQVFAGYRKLITVRIAQPAFHPNAPQRSLDLGPPAVFALERGAAEDRILALYNLSDQPQTVALPYSGQDLLSDEAHSDSIRLTPFQIVWLKGG
jgi:sucrose phosphorylase